MLAHCKISLWAIALLAAAAEASATASAGEPTWPPGSYKYIVIDQDLRDALIEFGRNLGLPIEVSDRVKGRLRGPLPVSTAEEFLKGLCASYGLVSYFDGVKLHINSESEIKTELIELGGAPANELVRKLGQLGVRDSRYPVNVSSDAKIVSVSGPPAYISLIRQMLVAGTKAATPKPVREIESNDETRVRVFRGSSG